MFYSIAKDRVSESCALAAVDNQYHITVLSFCSFAHSRRRRHWRASDMYAEQLLNTQLSKPVLQLLLLTAAALTSLLNSESTPKKCQ